MSARSDRRAAVRAPFVAPVDLELSRRCRRAEARDVSIRGLGLALELPHPTAGSAVVSEFPLPGMRVPLRLHARVAWSDPDGERLGLAFGGLPGELRELLECYVQERSGA